MLFFSMSIERTISYAIFVEILLEKTMVNTEEVNINIQIQSI